MTNVQQTKINQQCIYLCGPYQGYCGKAEYDHEADLFHGEVAGTRDVVTFQGRTPKELRKAFQESVDDYLAYCQERGEQPEKPFSGKFITRVDPEVHRKISQLAELAGKSLNQFICDCLESVAKGLPIAGAAPGVSAPTRRTLARSAKQVAARGKKKPRRAREHA